MLASVSPTEILKLTYFVPVTSLFCLLKRNLFQMNLTEQ